MQYYGGYPVTLDASVDTTNPTTTTILADTGALPGGVYEARFVFGASAAAIFAIQRRNAANDANVGDAVNVYCPANDSKHLALRWELEVNERLRVTMQTNLTGDASAAVSAQRCG